MSATARFAKYALVMVCIRGILTRTLRNAKLPVRPKISRRGLNRICDINLGFVPEKNKSMYLLLFQATQTVDPWYLTLSCRSIYPISLKVFYHKLDYYNDVHISLEILNVFPTKLDRNMVNA